MASELIKYAFVAGEIAKTLWARSDLEKYDLAVAQATNWFVDYRGGISTRPGTRFLDFCMHGDKATKFVPFKFAPAVAQTYVLVFGDLYVRFLQDGAYILEASKTVTGATNANPGVFTSVGHGFANGDWIKLDLVGLSELNGRSLEVANVTANTFTLKNVVTGADIDTTTYGAFVSGTASRIYTVTTPYAAADLADLRAHQSKSVIYLTHNDYKVRTLTRVADANWTLALVNFTNGLSRPGTPTVDAGAGAAGVGFVVTAVDIDGVESQPSDYGFDTTAVDYSSTAGSAKVTWTGVSGAVLYRVYRTQIIPTGAQCTRAMQVGLAGIAYGTEFIDNNVTPDFTITPPSHQAPFEDGAIEYIEVTAGGAGYTNASVVSITTGTGTGFIGYPVINSAGNLVAIQVINGGKGYISADTVNVTVGAGATFSKTLSPATGNNPAVSSVFQQRKVYAATDNDPLTLWASKPGDFENMDVDIIIQEDDSYEFDIESDEVAPIRHLLATRSGLVIISQAGIWQLTGGQGQAVTPTNALADPQSYTGASSLPPLPIDTDILYQEGKGATVRLLSYNDYTKVFAGQDLSILSNHLTQPKNPIVAWTYASDPFKLVHAIRSDGIMLNLTLVKEQNVYGWATQQTRGLYKDAVSIQEDRQDTVYLMVQRLINGTYVRMIEQIVRRDFDYVEDAWCLDAALANDYNYPAATITASASAQDEIITLTTDVNVFTPFSVGDVVRMGGGKIVITAYTSATQVTGKVMRAITNIIPEDETLTPLPSASGDWTLDQPITEVGGLWHLVGQTVKLLVDGNVLPDAVVGADGFVTFGTPGTRIIVGLGYKAVMRSLPPSVEGQIIEGKRKRIVGLKARQVNSRGLKTGNKLDNLYPVKERTDEAYAEPTRLQDGVKNFSMGTNFNPEGQFYIVQEDPLPATILGFITDLQIGDVASGNRRTP